MQFQWREDMLDEKKWSIIQEQTDQLLGKTPSVPPSVAESALLLEGMPPKVNTAPGETQGQ